MSQSEFLSVDDVAAIFGVTPKTIWAWVELHQFPGPFRVNARYVRWTRSVIDQFIAEKTGKNETKSAKATD